MDVMTYRDVDLFAPTVGGSLPNCVGWGSTPFRAQMSRQQQIDYDATRELFSLTHGSVETNHWPLMRRAISDRFTYCIPSRGVTLRWFADAEVARQVCERSVRAPLAHFTVPMRQIGAREEPSRWCESQFVPGSHPLGEAPIKRILVRLHASTPASRADVESAYRDRVLSRVPREDPLYPHLYSEISSWSGWTRLAETQHDFVSWHGDATLSNCVVSESASHEATLIDHSPIARGPREYDYAKLRRSLVLSDDGRWRDDPRTCRGDLHLAVVVLGMLGSHWRHSPIFERLLEFWREIRG